MYIVFTHDEDGNKIRFLSTRKVRAKKILKELCSKYGEAEMIPLKFDEPVIFEIKD